MLAPEEQMFVDFGQLIHAQIPGTNGQTLPPDLTFGAYRVRDLTDSTAASLYEGKVIVDKTFGHVSYGCVICCGIDTPFLAFDPIVVNVGGFTHQGVQALNTCTERLSTVTGDFATWWTDNTGIATASGSSITGVRVGTTTNRAQSITMFFGPKEDSGGGPCPQDQEDTSGDTNVTQCPGSVSLANLTPIPLEQTFPASKTGIGAVVSMQVGPLAAQPYDGSQVVEQLSVSGVMQNTCTQVSECNGGDTFTVGVGGSEFGLPFPPANNIFYDSHTLQGPTSILDSMGLNTCTYSCNQTYFAVSDAAGNSCGRANLGGFLITYTLIKATISGASVTRVQINKQ